MNRKTTTTYTINGQHYPSIDEVPENLRHLVEDRDGNGRPDWVDEQFAMMGQASKRFSKLKELTDHTSLVNTVEVRTTSSEELPDAMRKLFESNGGLSSLWSKSAADSLFDAIPPASPMPPPTAMPEKPHPSIPPVIPGMIPPGGDGRQASSGHTTTTILLAALCGLVGILIAAVLFLVTR